MNIGFYGHSAACWAEFPIYGHISFIDIVVKHFGAKLVNKGTPQGSEERVLFELKKTKQIDLAVILHSHSNFMFLPSCQRDITLKELNDKAAYMWREIKENSTELAKAKERYFSYGGIKETFADIETFLQTIALYKEYLHHPDLAMNRYTGALVQIDQYITSKNIPCIHVPIPNKIPSWFNFTSGLVDYELYDFIESRREEGFPNNISVKGQTEVANILIDHINQM